MQFDDQTKFGVCHKQGFDFFYEAPYERVFLPGRAEALVVDRIGKKEQILPA